MKTKVISALKKELLIIELPEEWTFNIYKDQIGFCNEINKPIEQIKGSYTLLGKPDEIKEDDAKELVESWESVAKDGTRVYENYKNGIPKKRTALESFNSALESEIYWDVNPLGTEPNHIDYKFEKYKGEYHFKSESHKSRYGNAYEKWQQAEFDTFDRNRTLIFVKKLN